MQGQQKLGLVQGGVPCVGWSCRHRCRRKQLSGQMPSSDTKASSAHQLLQLGQEVGVRGGHRLSNSGQDVFRRRVRAALPPCNPYPRSSSCLCSVAKFPTYKRQDLHSS